MVLQGAERFAFKINHENLCQVIKFKQTCWFYWFLWIFPMDCLNNRG